MSPSHPSAFYRARSHMHISYYYPYIIPGTKYAYSYSSSSLYNVIVTSMQLVVPLFSDL